MAVHSRDRTKPSLRDLLDEDARVIVIESFRPRLGRVFEKGEFHRFADPIVGAYPTHFAIVIPVSQVLEIER